MTCMQQLGFGKRTHARAVSSMRLAAIQNVADAVAHPQTCVPLEDVSKLQSASLYASKLSEAVCACRGQACGNFVFVPEPACYINFEDCIELEPYTF